MKQFITSSGKNIVIGIWSSLNLDCIILKLLKKSKLLSQLRHSLWRKFSKCYILLFLLSLRNSGSKSAINRTLKASWFQCGRLRIAFLLMIIQKKNWKFFRIWLERFEISVVKWMYRRIKRRRWSSRSAAKTASCRIRYCWTKTTLHSLQKSTNSSATKLPPGRQKQLVQL